MATAPCVAIDDQGGNAVQHMAGAVPGVNAACVQDEFRRLHGAPPAGCCGSSAGQLSGQADEAARQEHHAGNDAQAESEVPVLGKVAKHRFGLEKFLQQRKGKSADQRAAQMA